MVVLQELDGEPEPPLVTRAEQLKSVAKAKAKAKAKGKTSKRGRGRGRGSHGKGRGRAATANAVELVVSSQEPGLLDDEDDAGEDHGEAILKKPAAKAPPEEDGEAEEDEEADDFKPVFKKPAAKLQKKRVGPEEAEIGKKAKLGGDTLVPGMSRLTFAGRRTPDGGLAKDRFVALQVAYFTFVTPVLESPSTHEAVCLA